MLYLKKDFTVTDMKICIAGLGLIGGSMALALKRAGYEVSGWNRSPAPLKYALENNVIDEAADEFSSFDVVFVALPPDAAAEFIDGRAFKDGAIVSDICGVKGWIESEVCKKPRNFRYVGCHPMAGKEVSGVENSCADLFDRASMVVVRSPKTDNEAADIIEKLSKDMGFARLVLCTAQVHDRKIAYTSQLAHVLSNAYVKDVEIEECFGFTGGSFQDMTRIAGVDENVWAALYLKNADNICAKINSLESSLEEIKRAIEEGDEDNLRAVLRRGRQLFAAGKENLCKNTDIFVKYFK